MSHQGFVYHGCCQYDYEKDVAEMAKEEKPKSEFDIALRILTTRGGRSRIISEQFLKRCTEAEVKAIAATAQGNGQATANVLHDIANRMLAEQGQNLPKEKLPAKGEKISHAKDT